MRIAMMTNNYKPFIGGVPISIERLAGALRQCGHEVDVFAPSYEGQRAEPGVLRYRSHKRKLTGGIVLPDILDESIERRFRAKPYDVIHAHHPMLIGYAAQHLSRRYGVPLALTYHTRYERYMHYVNPFAGNGGGERTDKLLKKAALAHNRAFANRCDVVFAPSASVQLHLLRQGVRSPVRLLPTGLAPEDFAVNHARSQALREKYRPEGGVLFCCVARLEKEKNLELLLGAMARYKQQGAQPFRLLLIGEGSQRGRLVALAKELGLAREVCFVGSVAHDELSDYYAACDLFAFASTSETQGIVLLEAMAAGLPVVAVTSSGVVDAVAAGVNGLLCGEDAGQFAQSLAEALRDPQRYDRMRRSALEKARSCDAVQIAMRAEGYYTELLNERRRVAYGLAYQG